MVLRNAKRTPAPHDLHIGAVGRCPGPHTPARRSSVSSSLGRSLRRSLRRSPSGSGERAGSLALARRRRRWCRRGAMPVISFRPRRVERVSTACTPRTTWTPFDQPVMIITIPKATSANAAKYTSSAIETAALRALVRRGASDSREIMSRCSDSPRRAPNARYLRARPPRFSPLAGCLLRWPRRNCIARLRSALSIRALSRHCRP